MLSTEGIDQLSRDEDRVKGRVGFSLCLSLGQKIWDLKLGIVDKQQTGSS